MGRRVLSYIRRNAFEDGFFSVFGLTETLEAAVREVNKNNIESSLKGDQQTIANDFAKIFKQESALIDVEK